MYPSTKYNLNGGSTTQDIRLNYVPMPNWQVGTKQTLLGSDYEIVEPSSKLEAEPTQVEFEMPNNKSVLLGLMTKFRIKGAFQFKTEGEAAVWANVTAAEGKKVQLAPFWFEMLIKEIAVFHNNYKVASSTETRFIAPFLHAYLHAYMEPTAKKLLCPQLVHPAYCLPKKNEKWTAESEGWKEYSERVFLGKSIAFEYTPLFTFPFYQGDNFMMDQEGVPRALHMPALGNMQIRFTFHDNQDRIFRKVDGNKNTYRFAFKSFRLVVEQARLNPNPVMEKALQSPKKNLVYPGVTRLQLVEQIPNSQTTYKCKFQDIVLPESLFIFVLDKTVASGTYIFTNDPISNIFRSHNIQSVDLTFDGIRYAIREPHIGTFRDDAMDSKNLFDHILNPPFGIRQDIAKLTHASMREASNETAFPHIYIPLTKGPDRQRLVPAMDNGNSTLRKSDLVLDFKFTDDNSADNSIYVIYACYTDVNMVYDFKKHVFYSPYLKYMN